VGVRCERDDAILYKENIGYRAICLMENLARNHRRAAQVGT